MFGGALIFLALLAPLPRPQSQPVSALVFTLDGRYNSMHSWQADFTQVYSSPASGSLQTQAESGHLYLEKPGKMRWDYTTPQKKMFLVSGNKIWQYTAGESQATVTEIKQSSDLRTPLRYLLGHTELEKELSGLSYSGLVPIHAGDAVIHGKPKDPAETAGWSEVWIEVTPAYEIDRIMIASPDGSTNDIRLSHIEPNAAMPKGIFTFNAPAGVTLVAGGG